MEDVLVLDKMLTEYPNDRLLAFEEYTKHRQPDAHAICDLAMYNYIEVSSKSAQFESYNVKLNFPDA